MCKLVPLELSTGEIAYVAEHKKDKLKRYMDVFPNLVGVSQVILFGSTLEERCREDSDIDLCFIYAGPKSNYREAINWMVDNFPECVYGDMIGCSLENYTTNNIMGALWDVKKRGVVLYDSN